MAPNPDPAEPQHGLSLFEDMLELTVRLGAPGLTMVPGIDWLHETHEESLMRAAAELGRRASAAREWGVRFSVEPHVGSVCRTPEDIARLCELAPDLELTLDYTHCASQGFTEQEIKPLLAHARHAHVRGGADGRLQTALRENTIDYERVIDELRKHGMRAICNSSTYGWNGEGSTRSTSFQRPSCCVIDSERHLPASRGPTLSSGGRSRRSTRQRSSSRLPRNRYSRRDRLDPRVIGGDR